MAETRETGMVERVARAICAADCSRVTPNELDRCRDLARAAIKAMREPTREMYEAVLRADGVDGGTLRDNLRVMHQAAIDAALSRDTPHDL